VPKNVLVTGFEPFGGDRVNPSELVVRAFEARVVAERPIQAVILPVQTRTLRVELDEAIAKYRPDVIICCTQGAGRTAVAVERVAVNLMDFEKPDNVGVARKNEQIVRGGPEAQLSTLPVDKIVEAWHANGVPGYVSNASGTEIANQALYEALTLVAQATPPILVGLVQFPYLPAQALDHGPERTPSMSLDLMKKALEVAIEAVVPWVEARPERPAAAKPANAGANLWIPRGIKEVER